jgi:hypothetical protein
MQQEPRVGEISADGMFRWDGREWAPLAGGHREPTAWTRRLQWAATAYFAVAALQILVTNALFESQQAIERALRAQNATLPAEQLNAAASFGLVAAWAVAIVEAAAWLFLAVASFRGWRWAFWVDLAAFALISIGVATNLLALSNPAVQVQPQASIAVGLLFSLAALALLVAFIAAAARYGPWAMRRPSR